MRSTPPQKVREKLNLERHWLKRDVLEHSKREFFPRLPPSLAVYERTEKATLKMIVRNNI